MSASASGGGSSGSNKRQRQTDEVGEDETGGRGGGGGAAGAGVLQGAPAPAPAAPEYDGNAPALEVLADPWFYTNETYANMAEEARQNTFAPGETIRQVRKRYPETEANENSLAVLAGAISANFLRIRQYFTTVELSVEDWLAKEEVVDLVDGAREVETYRSRRVDSGMPTARIVLKDVREGERDRALCFVLGPSGSGKTFFALEHLRDFRKTGSGLRSVALYVKPGGTDVDFESLEAPSKLGLCVRSLLNRHIQRKRVDWSSRCLKLHVCFIFDEAGSSALQGFFDDPDKVRALVRCLEAAKIAASFTVVAVGTGLVATAFDSTKDAFVFRMRPWARDDLEKLMSHAVSRPTRADDCLYLKPGVDTPESVARAVYALPLLQALSTNGRSSYYLVRTIAQSKRRTPQLNELGWPEHLSLALPAIVDEVVSSYIDANGIKNLDPAVHPRVAAWLFGALSRLKKDETDPPELDGLREGERKRAELLLQLNVQNENSLKLLLPGQRFSATVTPATAIVMFHLAGVLTGILSGWRGEEEVVALYAAQRGIIDRWREHAVAVKNLQKKFIPDRDNMSLADFDKALDSRRNQAFHDGLHPLSEAFAATLKELRVHRLQRQVQSPKCADVYIPAVARHSIVMTVDRASFADVIAHRMLLQAKHTDTPEKPVKVDLSDEMRKCGLLKEGGHDRALRGLLLLWDGTLKSRAPTDEIAPGSGATLDDFSDLQESKCFPANMIKSHKPQDFVAYHKINAEDVVEPQGIALPDRPERLDVTFVLCTNAKTLQLDVTPLSSRAGDGKSNKSAAAPEIQAGKPSEGTQSDDGTMSVQLGGSGPKGMVSMSPTEPPEIVSVTEESLDQDLGIDVEQLVGGKEAWARFCDAVVDGVKIQFLFTRGA